MLLIFDKINIIIITIINIIAVRQLGLELFRFLNVTSNKIFLHKIAFSYFFRGLLRCS
jgi:hypothetical protein